MDFTIKVFTLNCWGIVYVSKDRRARMQAIAKHLSSSDVDFVCLQEVWTVKDFLYIKNKCTTTLPFSHYFNSGVNGPGLCILSRYPIVDVYFHQWPINGYAHKVHQGDWFGGKGVGLCRIQMRERVVNLYTTHLHAEYNIESLEYLNHRILQSFDMSQFIKLTSRDCDVAILAGDLNSEPDDPAIPLLLLNAQLQDSFTVAQKKNPDCLGTNEGCRNSYAPAKELKRQPEGKRIDYIMFKHSKKVQVNVEEYLFPLPERVPGSKFSYSDHEAVQAVLQCKYDPGFRIGGGDLPQSKIESENSEDNSKLVSALNAALEICEESLKRLRFTKIKYWSAAAVAAIIVLISIFLEVLVPINDPTGIVFFNIAKVLLSAILMFTILMALLWNNIEESAILTGKYSMLILIRQITDP